MLHTHIHKCASNVTSVKGKTRSANTLWSNREKNSFKSFDPRILDIKIHHVLNIPAYKIMVLNISGHMRQKQ